MKASQGWIALGLDDKAEDYQGAPQDLLDSVPTLEDVWSILGSQGKPVVKIETGI